MEKTSNFAKYKIKENKESRKSKIFYLKKKKQRGYPGTYIICSTTFLVFASLHPQTLHVQQIDQDKKLFCCFDLWSIRNTVPGYSKGTLKLAPILLTSQIIIRAYRTCIHVHIHMYVQIFHKSIRVPGTVQFVQQYLTTHNDHPLLFSGTGYHLSWRALNHDDITIFGQFPH